MNRYAFAIAVAGIATMQFDTAHAQQSSLAGMAAMHAAANGVPVSLVHRVIMRESRYNPRAVSKGNYGIMQIRLGTARSMGYTGSAAGLLDPNTNMTYAVKYLAGAYRAAGGNESRAVSLYASGYYSHASRATYASRVTRRQVAATSYGYQPSYRSAYETRASRRSRVATNFSWFQPSKTYTSRSYARRHYATRSYASYRPRYARRTVWKNPFAALFTPSHSNRRVRYARSYWRHYN